MNAHRLSPPPLAPGVHPPRHSGTHQLGGAATVAALVDAIDQVCREGGVDPVYGAPTVLQNLNLCRPYHWSAYARLAGTPDPSPETISAVQARYIERCRDPR